MLKNPFFPPPPQADLSDLDGHIYLVPPECPVIITKIGVMRAIEYPRLDKVQSIYGFQGMASKVRHLTEQVQLVPNTQMGGRRGSFTKTTAETVNKTGAHGIGLGKRQNILSA